jgi:uncharacterized protein involved in response to NO
MTFSASPLWLVGFRPFFALACIAGGILPLLWIALFTGAVPPAPTFAVPMLQWHAHEMFYGFGWAMLGGFLLTASKNWAGIRGYHGATLVLLAGLWLFERVGMSFGGAWPVTLLALSSYAFLAVIIILLLVTLIRYRATDSYADNLYFILALPLFLPAKWLLLQPETFAAGWSMTLALFRLAFLIMLERTLTQFMKGIFRLSVLRSPLLDHSIKSLALVLVFATFLPPVLNAALSGLLGALILWRWVHWHPLKALTRLEIGVMFLAMLAMVLQLWLVALTPFVSLDLVGSLVVHVFTLGAMALIVPAMIMRIAKGHTGRKVVFDRTDKTVLWLMLSGWLLRVVLPQTDAGHYALWLWLTALCWLLAFGILALRYLPWLAAPRVDGKLH